MLERFKAKGLIEKLNIFPIHMGSDGVIDENVKEFRLEDERNYKDSLLERYNVHDENQTRESKIGLDFFMQCALSLMI